MTEYLVVNNGYGNYNIAFVEGDEDLFGVLYDPDVEYAFELTNAIDIHAFKTRYLAEFQERETHRKALVAAAKTKLTKEEIEALGI